MAPQFSYISPGNWTEVLTNTVRLGKVGLVTCAEMGNPGISTIVLDNPDGTLGHSSDSIVAYKQFAVDELLEDTGDQRVYLGYIGRRQYRRGQGTDSSLRTGPADEAELTLTDLNWLLTLHIVTGTDGNRPSETVSVRMAWLLASTYLSGLVYDNGFVAASSTVMDAVDYRGQKPLDVIGDMATTAFYNFFVYNDESAGQASLWFDDSNTSSNYDSGCSISDDLTDIDQAAIIAGTATTFYGFYGDTLDRDPERVYSGAYLPYAKGNVYRTSATIESNFIARDGSAPNSNVKTAATATAIADRFLADNDEEDDRMTRTIWVNANQGNAIKAGQLVQVKSTWMPGYSSYRYMRVLQKSLLQQEPANSFYTMTLELSPTQITVSILDYVTATDLSDFVAATFHADPPVGSTGVSILALRAANDSTLYPQSADGDAIGSAYIAGTAYTILTYNTISTGAGVYGINMAWRSPITADDTIYPRWSPAASLGGSSRPRSHNVLLGGVTTAGTPVSDGSANIPGSATPSSITVHADGPGIIIFGMTYQYPGPGDHVGWGGFTVTANSGVLLGYGYGVGDFAPLSWMSYLLVSSAGNYAMTFNLTPSGGEGDPLDSYDVARVGCWFG